MAAFGGHGQASRRSREVVEGSELYTLWEKAAMWSNAPARPSLSSLAR